MIKFEDLKDSDVFLVRVKKNAFCKDVFIIVGYIVKIGDDVVFRRTDMVGKYGGYETINNFDLRKINKKIKKIEEELGL